MANITASVIGRNRKRPMPGTKMSGDNTRNVQSVATSSRHGHLAGAVQGGLVWAALPAKDAGACFPGT